MHRLQTAYGVANTAHPDLRRSASSRARPARLVVFSAKRSTIWSGRPRRRQSIGLTGSPCVVRAFGSEAMRHEARAARARSRQGHGVAASRLLYFRPTRLCCARGVRERPSGLTRERTGARGAKVRPCHPKPHEQQGTEGGECLFDGHAGDVCEGHVGHWKISVVQSPPWRRTSCARAGPSGRSWRSTKKSGSISMPPSGEQLMRSSHERSPG